MSRKPNLYKKANEDFLAAKAQEEGMVVLDNGVMYRVLEKGSGTRCPKPSGIVYVRYTGRLIDGTGIHDAIAYIDRVTDRNPVCYMTNCVHPAIVYTALSRPFNRTEEVRTRFLGIQGNTSPLSYAELDRSAPGTDLKNSTPEQYAEGMLRLRETFGLRIFGGCCGTDGRYLKRTAELLTTAKK